MFFRLIFTCVMLLMGFTTAAAQKDSAKTTLPDSVSLVLPKADAVAARWYDVKVACDNGTKRTLIIKQ